MSKPRKARKSAAPIFPAGTIFEKKTYAVLEIYDPEGQRARILRDLNDDGTPSSRLKKFDWQRMREAGWVPAAGKVADE